MIKKILYTLSVVSVFAICVMILLNGSGLVEYRLNTIISYVSRSLIIVLIILFGMAIVNVRRSRDDREEWLKDLHGEHDTPAYLHEGVHSDNKLNSINEHKQFNTEGRRPSMSYHPMQGESDTKASRPSMVNNELHMQKTKLSPKRPVTTPSRHLSQQSNRPKSTVHTQLQQNDPVEQTNTWGTPTTPISTSSDSSPSKPRGMDITVKRKRPRRIQL